MGKIAFLFAGQGAQYAGMGKSLYEGSPAARFALDTAEQLRPGTLLQCFEGTKDELSQTLNTQPCLMAVNYACAAALMEAGVKPDGLAGFSLGEIAALPVSGLLSFGDAFRLVLRRAALMQECAEQTQGGMIAVLKLSDAQVEALCAAHNAYAVNYNCPGQVVCALRKEDMQTFTDAVKAMGGRALPLAVNGGFHSPMMQKAATGMREYAAALPFQEPAIPLYADATCERYTKADAAMLLGAQVESPVRFTKLIQTMQNDGYDQFVEVGAGKTLSGLLDKIGNVTCVGNVDSMEGLQQTLSRIKGENQC